MTERVATGAEVRRDSEWLKLSHWWDTVMVRTGKLAATGWVRALSISDPPAPTLSTGTGHGRGAIAVAHDGVWVSNRMSRTVARLEPHTLELTAIQRFRKAPVAIVAGPDAVWPVGANGWLWRLRPDTMQAEGVARLGRRTTAVAVAGGLVWVLRRNGRLYGLDPASGEVTIETRVPRGASHMIGHDDELWVASRRSRQVSCVDPQSGQQNAEIRLDQRVRCLAPAGSSLLAGCALRFPRDRGWLHTIDRRSGQVVATTELASQPRAIAVGGKTAWLACGRGLNREGTIERIDLDTGQVNLWRSTSYAIGDLALVDNALLAAMSLELAMPVDGGHFVGGAGGGGGDCGGGGHGGGGGHC